MPVSLRIVRGKDQGRVFELRGESRAVIGRAPDATITLDDARLSRKHCRIEFSKGSVRLVDLDSTNGTFIDKKKVHSVAISPRVFFQAGSNLFQIFPVKKRSTAPRDGFVCPRCREDVSTQQPAGSTREVDCPHCGRPTIPGKEVLGQYQILEVIGKGSTGLVYKAQDLREDRMVALKAVRLDSEIDSKTISRYLRMSQTECMLFHPNIVQVYRTGQANGYFIIAMEYVEGITLYQKIVEEERLKVDEALGIASQVTSGLIHASGKGIVHRDVKPENILVTPDGVAKLMDFSIAKRVRGDPEAPVTLAGEGLGTLYYVPPEQIYNAANVDGRADVYALGCTLYHMLTGWPPFKESKEVPKKQGVLIRILSGDCRPIEESAPSVPPEVTKIVNKAMARPIEERYQTPDQLLTELKSVQQALQAESS